MAGENNQAPPSTKGSAFRQHTRSPAPSGHTRIRSQVPSKGSQWIKIALTVLLVSIGAYVGYVLIGNWQSRLNESRRKAEANADGGEMGHIANVYQVLEATEPGGGGLGGGSSRYEPADLPRGTRLGSRAGRLSPDSPNPRGELPVIPPAWTIDVGAAKIPESQVNGQISGVRFVSERARLDVVAGAYVLSLRQGTNVSPDGEILVYLRPKVGEKVAGGSWSLGPDSKSSSVSQVAKRWKPNPKYAATLKSFTTGYALKLELGPIEDGELAGRIFIALPDQEHSVVAGSFTATTALPDSTDTAQPTVRDRP